MRITLTHQIRYAEMIDEAMDKFPVKTLGDFEAITTCLNSILHPEGGYLTRKDLAERKECIADFLNTPSLYVQYTTDYDEYQALIRARITAKINELGQLTEAQKQACIDEQEQRRISAEQNQMIRAEHSPPQPGEEKHTIPLNQMLQEIQRQFQQELIPRVLDGAITAEQYVHLCTRSGVVICDQTWCDICLLIRDAGVTFTELDGIQDPTILRSLLYNAHNVIRLIHTMDVTLEELVELPSGPLHTVLTSPDSQSTREILKPSGAMGMLQITSQADLRHFTGKYVVIDTHIEELHPIDEFTKSRVRRFHGTNMFYAKVNGVVTRMKGCAFWSMQRKGRFTCLSYDPEINDFDLNGSVKIRLANEDELNEMKALVEDEELGARFGTLVRAVGRSREDKVRIAEEGQAQIDEIEEQRLKLAMQQQDGALAVAAAGP